ncbi:hypothetical protein GF386_05955 [Candidatus Pacearchaeota archaeon]|nr:hypothetical protein [Candidatus Pacearchaeota archaeon]MBD3283637.1 hypothetical protein [Candidatus Pacearchaeota archaeon]
MRFGKTALGLAFLALFAPGCARVEREPDLNPNPAYTLLNLSDVKTATAPAVGVDHDRDGHVDFIAKYPPQAGQLQEVLWVSQDCEGDSWTRRGYLITNRTKLMTPEMELNLACHTMYERAVANSARALRDSGQAKPYQAE